MSVLLRATTPAETVLLLEPDPEIKVGTLLSINPGAPYISDRLPVMEVVRVTTADPSTSPGWLVVGVIRGCAGSNASRHVARSEVAVVSQRPPQS